MAYSDPTYTTPRTHGPGTVVSLTGTSLALASKVLLDKLPAMGRIVRLRSAKGSGTATAAQPRLTSDADGLVVVAEFTASTNYADGVDELFDPPPTYYAPAGLYYWPMPATGSDNALTDEIHVLPGWGA